MASAGEARTLLSPDGTEWRPEDRPCPVCGSQRVKVLGARGGHAHRERKGAPTNVVRCVDCTVLYTKPTLVPLSNPYARQTAEDYFVNHDMHTKIRKGEGLAAFAESVFGGPESMLELGCGRGEFLAGAKNRGWKVAGVEMTQGFADVASSQGVDVEVNAIEDCSSLDHQYDVVILAAILEHLYDPMETLRRIHAALRPGGLVFIDVPNESSLTMHVGNLYMRLRNRGSVVNLSPTFPPYHVVGFSPKSLRHALTSVGFRIHSMTTPKWENMLPEGGTLMRRIEHSALSAVQSIGSGLGLGDGIDCWAIRA
jgi:SAM-dependent methyltransferase